MLFASVSIWWHREIELNQKKKRKGQNWWGLRKDSQEIIASGRKAGWASKNSRGGCQPRKESELRRGMFMCAEWSWGACHGGEVARRRCMWEDLRRIHQRLCIELNLGLVIFHLKTDSILRPGMSLPFCRKYARKIVSSETLLKCTLKIHSFLHFNTT